MKTIAVCGQREWSFLNFKPAQIELEKTFNVITVDITVKEPPKADVIITVEPHNKQWINFYQKNKGKIPCIALQQGLYWSDTPNASPVWAFDKYLVWGEQMRECCLMNKLLNEQIIVTGCPRHDYMFDCKKLNDGTLVILEDYWLGVQKKNKDKVEQLKNEYNFSSIVVTNHPSKTNYTLKYDTLEYIRRSAGVLIGETGPGIWAMIMEKPCIAFRGFGKRNDYKRAKCFQSKEFVSDNKEYVTWAVTGPGATERVVKAVINEL